MSETTLQELFTQRATLDRQIKTLVKEQSKRESLNEEIVNSILLSCFCRDGLQSIQAFSEKYNIATTTLKNHTTTKAQREKVKQLLMQTIRHTTAYTVVKPMLKMLQHSTKLSSVYHTTKHILELSEAINNSLATNKEVEYLEKECELYKDARDSALSILRHSSEVVLTVDKYRTAIEYYILDNVNYTEACKRAEVNYDSFKKWRKNNPDLFEKLSIITEAVKTDHIIEEGKLEIKPLIPCTNRHYLSSVGVLQEVQVFRGRIVPI